MIGALRRLRARLADVRVFASPERRRRVAVHALLALAVLVGATLLARRHLGFLSDPEALRAFVRGYGGWAPVVMIGLQAAQVVLAPVPGQVLAVASGYLFGPWWGTLYNLVGVTLGSAVAFWLARRFGRAYVERTVDDDALRRFDAIDDGRARATLFVLFLVPGLPDDAICFAGGLTGIPLWQLVVIAAVGRAPGFLLANVVGGFLGTDRLAAAVVLALALVALSALGYRYRGRLLGPLGDGPDE